LPTISSGFSLLMPFSLLFLAQILPRMSKEHLCYIFVERFQSEAKIIGHRVLHICMHPTLSLFTESFQPGLHHSFEYTSPLSTGRIMMKPVFDSHCPTARGIVSST
jgi:hypothetical protein